MSMATAGPARRQSRTRSIHWKSVAESLCVWVCECVSVCESESEREEIRMRDKSGVCKAMLCCSWWSVEAAMWICGLASP